MLEETLIVSKGMDDIHKEIAYQLYGSKHRSISQLQYLLFYSKKVKIESHLLSPAR